MNARSIGAAIALAGLLVSGQGDAQEIVNLPGEDRHLEVDFEELYRIGLVSGEHWEQFGNVRMVGFDGAGLLYVFDSVADRISVVSLDGEFVRAFGRPGGRPRRVPEPRWAHRHAGRQGGDRRHRSSCIPHLPRKW